MNDQITERPISITIISILCLAVISLTIYMCVHSFYTYPYANSFEKRGYVFIILLQLPVITGVIMMFFLKRAGIWVFLLGKIAFLFLPPIAGFDTLGMAFPLFFIESAVFFVLFGKRAHYMK